MHKTCIGTNEKTNIKEKNIKSGIAGAVLSHLEGQSDPMSPSLQYEHWLPTWHQLQHTLIWGRGKPGHFDCASPRRKSIREERGLIILSEFFLCRIFPVWQGRFKVWTQKKFMLPRAVLGLVTTPAAGPTISISLTAINNSVGKTIERTHFPPQCVKSKAKLGHWSMNPHFQPGGREAKEGITYPVSDHMLSTGLGTSGQPAHVTDGESEA